MELGRVAIADEMALLRQGERGVATEGAMRPRSGSAMPAMSRNSEVLPAPLAPRSKVEAAAVGTQRQAGKNLPAAANAGEVGDLELHGGAVGGRQAIGSRQ